MPRPAAFWNFLWNCTVPCRWLNSLLSSSGWISFASVVLLQLPGTVWDGVYRDGPSGSSAKEADELHPAGPGERGGATKPSFVKTYFQSSSLDSSVLWSCRFAQNVKGWKRQTCRCTADVLETMTWPSQPRFVLCTVSSRIYVSVSKNVNQWFLSLPPSTELLWADHSISEHCNSLQHEIFGWDYRLVASHEPANQPKRSLD